MAAEMVLRVDKVDAVDLQDVITLAGGIFLQLERKTFSVQLTLLLKRLNTNTADRNMMSD